MKQICGLFLCDINVYNSVLNITFQTQVFYSTISIG